MSTFLKVVGILLILSGIGLFLMSTSSAAEVGSKPVRNQYEALGRDIGLGLSWTAVSCVSLVLFISGVFTWWAGHNAGKSQPPATVIGNVTAHPKADPESEWEVPPIRKAEKREPASAPRTDNRPIVVQGAKRSVRNIIIGWSLFLYIAYAGLHIYSWSECDGNSAILTLFPLRQIYLVRAVEEKWHVRESLARSLILAIEAGQDEDSILHIVKHGDCILLSALMTEVSKSVPIVKANSSPQVTAPDRQTAPLLLTSDARAEEGVKATVVLTAEPIEESCFPYDRAYVTGNMNIRESASTNSPVARVTDTKVSYRVLEVYQGETWCWLKVVGGWMALTSYVSHDMSVLLPSIDSDEPYFKNKVTRAFELLGQKSTHWFKYTVGIVNSVVLADLSAENALAQVTRDGKMEVKMDRKVRTRDIALVASALVHEACHLYQHNDTSRQRSLLGYEEEEECYTIQARALSSISPGHSMIQTLRCAAEHYPLTSLC